MSASDEPGKLTIAELGASFRARELSPVELVEALLARTRRLDGRVGAFIEVTAERVRRQARAAERALGEGDDRPLLGVPVAVKDLIDTAGVATTAGSRVLADNVPARDAAVWRRLRRAGAVLIGKANAHEFAYGGTTEPTRNPWDLTRMVGGSSGGSAAALAAGLSPAAIGTDSAGSVRIPAGFCGVFGLKPTRGLVPRSGVVPLSPTLDVVGPLARTPVDLGLLLDAMVGHDSADPMSVRRRRPATYAPTPGSPSGSPRVGLLAGFEPMSAGVRAALEEARAAFEAAGAEVEEASIGNLDAATEACFTIMAVEAADFHEEWLRDRAELYTPYVRERIGEGAEISGVAYRRALAEARRVGERCEAALGGCDLLLAPGMPCPAPAAYVETITVAGKEYGRDYLVCRNTAFANLGGHPALAVPVAFEEGVPVGVQLIGRRFDDARLLGAAQVLHERLGGGPLVAELA